MKISVITVTYNSEAYLTDTIESVLTQDYKDIEYIIIDGNSSDSTIDIIKRYEKDFDGRMKWVSEPDNGMYDAINKGIGMATGEVIGMLNSDDFYASEDVVSNIAQAFSTNACLQSVYGDIRFVSPVDLSKTVRYYQCNNWRPWQLRFGFMPAHPSFYTRRENYLRYGLYKTDYYIAADYELIVRFLYHNKLSYRYIPMDFVKMRTGGRSTKNLRSNIILNQEIVRGCKENGVWTCMPLLFLKYFIKIKELLRK